MLKREYPQYAGLVDELVSVERFRLPGSGSQRERTLSTFRRHIHDEAIVQEIARKLYSKGVRIFPNEYRINISGDYKYSDSPTYKPGAMESSSTQKVTCTPLYDSKKITRGDNRMANRSDGWFVALVCNILEFVTNPNKMASLLLSVILLVLALIVILFVAFMALFIHSIFTRSP